MALKQLHHFNPSKYLLIVFSLILFTGCKENKEEDTTSYFGGYIINPKSDQVYLLKDEILIDSVQLDQSNKFLLQLDSVTTGLYTFRHGPEIQYLYLEPKDSLLIRLNTWDFDESLVFSGRGAERNNFLINLFLINEKEDRQFFEYYQLNDSLFQVKTDSAIQTKLNLFNQFKEDVTTYAPLYDKLVNAAIYYPLYRKKEAYPYRHKKALRSDKYPKIDPSFYKYRKSIDINDRELAFFYPHYDYVKTYLYHLAYEDQIINDFKSTMEVNFMEVAVNNITIPEIKNKFLYEGTLYTLLDEEAPEREKEIAKQLFEEYCTDKQLKTEIALLLKASQQLDKGQLLPDIPLKNFSDASVELTEVIKNKNTVIYTWPRGPYQLENFAKRINYLEKNYPEFLFIGINTHNSVDRWKSYMTSKKINPDHQYYSADNADWMDVNFSRAILVDNKGVVQNNLTHLNSDRFLKQLKKLKNQ